VAGGCAPESTRLCTAGGYVSGLEVTVGGLTSVPRRQSLRVRGTLFFPQGIPAAAPYTDGAQLAIEDVGGGDVAVFELSRFTTPVPPQASGVCGARDGWEASPSRVLYRNRSTALDPPVCTPNSARGLSHLRYRPRSTRDLDAEVRATRAALFPPAGPLRATFVLGGSQAASDAGHCAVSVPVACTAKGRSVRCR
jgi:hypothetical protein